MNVKLVRPGTGTPKEVTQCIASNKLFLKYKNVMTCVTYSQWWYNL